MQGAFRVERRGGRHGALSEIEMRAIAQIIPRDELRDRRISNMKEACRVYIKWYGRAVSGVTFIRRICSIPNMTCITAPGFDIEPTITEAKKDFLVITAMVRNPPARTMLKRAGFLNPLGNFWLWVRVVPRSGKRAAARPLEHER